METILDRLRKIEALANSGVAGERENARRMLAALCEKHGLSPQQITSPDRSWQKFRFRGEKERLIFQQVLIHVLKTRHVQHRKNPTNWEVFLTAAEGADVADCWAHYRDLWCGQLDDFCNAFIQKNRIFGPPLETRDDKKLTEQDIAEAKRIMAMMIGMEEKRWTNIAKLNA